jgi:hypothetical protein
LYTAHPHVVGDYEGAQALGIERRHPRDHVHRRERAKGEIDQEEAEEGVPKRIRG